MKKIISMEFGTNRLLKKGNILVTEAKDIIESFPELNYKQISLDTEKISYCFIPKEYLPVYKEIQKNKKDINELSRTLKMPIQDVNNILFMLELENYIEKLPGGEYQIKIE